MKPPVTCSRCMSTFTAAPMKADGETSCPACEPRDVSVFDFLYQFPRAHDIPELMRLGDWFVQPHETNIVAVHDDAWPTLYEDEKPHVVDENEFPKTVAHMSNMLFGEALYASSETLATTRKLFATESLLILPPVQMFAPNVLINAHHAKWLVDYAFAGINGRKTIAIEFIEVGVVRFTCERRVAILARIESNHDPVIVYGLDVYESAQAATDAAMNALDVDP